MNRFDRYLFKVNGDSNDFIELLKTSTVKEVARTLQIREDVVFSLIHYYKTKGLIKDVTFR